MHTYICMSLGVHNPPSGIPTHRKATYVFTHTYVHTHIHTYIHTQTYRQVNKHMCVHTYVHTCICTYWREPATGRRKVPGTYITWILYVWVTHICIQVRPWHHQCEGGVPLEPVGRSTALRKDAKCASSAHMCLHSSNLCTFRTKPVICQP